TQIVVMLQSSSRSLSGPLANESLGQASRSKNYLQELFFAPGAGDDPCKPRFVALGFSTIGTLYQKRSPNGSNDDRMERASSRIGNMDEFGLAEATGRVPASNNIRGPAVAGRRLTVSDFRWCRVTAL